MMTLFRTYRWLVVPALLLLAGTGTATAQVLLPVGPLTADPGRALLAPTAVQQAQQRTTALSLPFFDDFTSPLEGAPKVQNWRPTGGAFVSNRYALLPLTRGTATLDGLKANGQNYSSNLSASYGNLDSLISQPINLGGISVNDNVYLSFAWQAGNVTSTPNGNLASSPVRLELFLKTDAGVWESAWRYLSVNRRTAFRQQVVSLNQTRYLHGDFQFMLVATGDRSGNNDTWGVDYVLLDRGRTLGVADTLFNDIATSAGLRGGNPSGGLRSPLRRFAAMPVWQFNAASATASELNPHLGVNITNLSPGPLPIPITVQGTVQVRPTGPLLGNWIPAQTLRQVLFTPRQDSLTRSALRQPIPTTATPKTLRYTLALDNPQQTDPRTQPNDTIFRDVELNNYYAYDDGTAESFTNLIPYTTGQQSAFAYRFDLNQADYVRGLRMYPIFPGSDVNPSAPSIRILDNNARTVTISVWDNNAGQPASTPRATKTATIPAAAAFPASWQYYQIDFDQPVPVTGSFFVGFSQPSSSRILPYGLDQNSTYPAGRFWRRDNTGVWDSVRFATGRGALMMRPVMTNNVVTATASARDAAAFSLYPNPAHGTVAVAGPAFARAAVLDALGRTVWEQPAAQAGKATLELPTLPPGVYTVRLTLADGRVVGRRLMLE